MISKIYERILEREVLKGPLPRHVAIIMDGNRRFAQKLGKNPRRGYFFGAKKTEEVLRWLLELGIKQTTVYAFSTENFRRSREEREIIFELFRRKIRELMSHRMVHDNRVCVRVIGKRSLLPPDIISLIEELENRTSKYGKFFLNIAFAYGGRTEIVDAIRALMKDVLSGKLSPEEISEIHLVRHMYLNGDRISPDVDLIIRTGGEKRISNFLPWQAAGNESAVYFCSPYWPEFRKIDLLRAIRTYQQRLFKLSESPLNFDDPINS
ncbi:MAG: tritrans,polycis-undecaprenyl-diphosphate synthase [Archaeoglobi archaeon]|nr:tritrans,polycis-undecaprenyl-diphosphate synthase [Archaeoglobi archaeon]MDK2781440.1 tritrans,polycis-undecaprenyl-diphosphate synthase [Archaeoglobi archaeon]